MEVSGAQTHIFQHTTHSRLPMLSASLLTLAAEEESCAKVGRARPQVSVLAHVQNPDRMMEISHE